MFLKKQTNKQQLVKCFSDSFSRILKLTQIKLVGNKAGSQCCSGIAFSGAWRHRPGPTAPGSSKGSTSEFASAVHKKDTDDDCPVRVYHESQVPSASSLESGQSEDADTGQNRTQGKAPRQTDSLHCTDGGLRTKCAVWSEDVAHDNQSITGASILEA